MTSTTLRARRPLDFLDTAEPPPFALLHRPDATGDDIELITGDVVTATFLDDLPQPRGGAGAGHDLVVLLPYRQLRERGLHCHDDAEPIIALSVEQQTRLPRQTVLAGLEQFDVSLSQVGFDITDEEYAEVVERVLADEIGTGAGANFVIHRVLRAEVNERPHAAALAMFRALLLQERGAYWTFVVHTGQRTFVGATPERHVSLAGGTAVMNPISGTLRYPDGGVDVPEVLRFLADGKEADELFMVVDEELKMMSRICDSGVRVVGPRLKEMGRLAHTEYHLEGASTRDARDVLRETMFAPTVTGSPLENATRVIARHEPGGRSYYSGAIAAIGHDEDGAPVLDSSILIRTADIARDGALRVGVGATLVRNSQGPAEVAETHAKAAGLLAAAGLRDQAGAEGRAASPKVRAGTLADNPQVLEALAARNETLSRYWLGDRRPAGDLPLAGRRVLLIEAEDTFTEMLSHQLASIGARVRVLGFAEVTADDPRWADVAVLGPGPGDPRDHHDPKIAALRRIGDRLLAGPVPFLAVCLGHQVISSLLGLSLVRLEAPHQGTQQLIDLFGSQERVGFYNSYVARCDTPSFVPAAHPGIEVTVSTDPGTGAVHALRGPGFVGLQFHPESVLTQNGHRILADVLSELALVGYPRR